MGFIHVPTNSAIASRNRFWVYPVQKRGDGCRERWEEAPKRGVVYCTGASHHQRTPPLNEPAASFRRVRISGQDADDSQVDSQKAQMHPELTGIGKF
jgi:hypothetical protein